MLANSQIPSFPYLSMPFRLRLPTPMTHVRPFPRYPVLSAQNRYAVLDILCNGFFGVKGRETTNQEPSEGRSISASGSHTLG